MDSSGEYERPTEKTPELIRNEVLLELEKLKQIKTKIADALKWLNGSFKRETYKLLVDAQKTLDQDGTSMDKFTALNEARQKVNVVLSRSVEIKNLEQFSLSEFKHFHTYCMAHEIADFFNLRPLRPNQRTFNLPLYLEKISNAQVFLDSYINNTLFFLTSKQESLDIKPSAGDFGSKMRHKG
jgi:hypothetical protein